MLTDLLTNLERISDHCSNIAVSVIEEQNQQMDPHAYINDLKDEGHFNTLLRANLQKYRLPAQD